MKNKVRNLGFTLFALPALAIASNANAAGFDATSLAPVQTGVEAILGVGAAIAIGFVVYKLGKRGTSKL